MGPGPNRPAANELPDPRVVRRRADRTAASFDDHSHVYRELGRRLLEHLDPIRVFPEVVLDLGSGTGGMTRDLAERYPKSRVIGLDFSVQRLRRSVSRTPRWFSRQSHLCADACSLPLRDSSVDLVCANVLLPWVPAPPVLFRECARVLRHGGLIMLSSLGPDSLIEMRTLLADDGFRLHPQADMHQSANALVSCGFSDVVADTEHLRADYRGPADLLAELRGTGATYAAESRARHLAAGQPVAHLRLRQFPDPFTITYEVVYLHAWYLDRRSVTVSLPPARTTPR